MDFKSKPLPPKPPKHPSGNGQAKKQPSGPSPHVRENFIKKIKEIIKKKKSGG